jgi:hypothetical protein
MDRRGRLFIVLVVALAPVLVLLAPRAQPGATADAAAHPGGPSSSLAGSTTFAVIEPTAIPGSSVWNDNLAVPTPVAVAPGVGQAPGSGKPKPSGKPGRTAPPTTAPTVGPTSNPTIHPTLGPTANPTLGPTPRPTSNPTAAPTPVPTVKPTTVPTVAPTAAPTPNPTVNPGTCTLFPSDNVWNKRVDSLPVRGDSSTLIASIGVDAYLHPDFSSTAYNGGLGYGIPFNKVNLSTPTSNVAFRWADESDAGPYPIPSSPKIEGGSDRHLLMWDTEGCGLYELFNARKSNGAWLADSGAIWDLRSNALRPDGWTSADAAGLPILPGLVRWDDLADGAIRHALRFTAPDTRTSHIYPARHDAGAGSSTSLPPMGLRVRLKASVDISGFGPQAQVILLALKRYGMILADNGSPWYVTGAPSANWDDDDLHDFHQLHGSDFEAVDTRSLRNG